MAASRNVCSVKLSGVIKNLVNLYDHLINRVYFFYSKKHFTFLEGKWRGFKVNDFCIGWGSIRSGRNRKGEEKIQPTLLLASVMGGRIVLTLTTAGDGQEHK